VRQEITDPRRLTPLEGQVRVTCIVPTLNAERFAERLGQAIQAQSLMPSELLLIDSSSDDNTISAFEQYGFNVLSIDREDFNHGAVRNLAARHANGDVLVYLTQDAIPKDASWLENLIAPIRAGTAVATFARQVPDPSDSPLAAFARHHNYPAHSRLVTPQDISTLGIRAAFFSNSCSAIRSDVFHALGGFRSDTIMNEDMLFAATLLNSGYAHYYCSDSLVIHSHDYSLAQTFRRYFDIGVVFAQAREELKDFRAGGEGLNYAFRLIGYLVSEHRYWWIPRAILESLAKFAALQLGKRYRQVPRRLLPRLSMHSGYWTSG